MALFPVNASWLGFLRVISPALSRLHAGASGVEQADGPAQAGPLGVGVGY